MDLPPEIVSIILSYTHPYHRNQYRLTCKHTYSSISIKENIELSLIYNPIAESLQYYDPLHCLYYALKRSSNIEIFLNELKDITVKVAITVAALLFEFKKEDHLLLLSQEHKHTFVFRSILHAYSISFLQVKPQWVEHKVYGIIANLLGNRDFGDLFMFMTPLNRMLLLGSLSIGYELPFGINQNTNRQTKTCLGYLTDDDLPAAKLFLSKHFPSLTINPVRNTYGTLVVTREGYVTLPPTPFRSFTENKPHLIKSLSKLEAKKQGIQFIFAGLYDEYVKWKQENKLTFVYISNDRINSSNWAVYKDVQIEKLTSILGVVSYNRDCLNTPVYEKEILPKSWYY